PSLLLLVCPHVSSVLFLLVLRLLPSLAPFPTRRSSDLIGGIVGRIVMVTDDTIVIETSDDRVRMELTKWAVSTNNTQQQNAAAEDRKSTRLNSSHVSISYAVFCLKKKNTAAKCL